MVNSLNIHVQRPYVSSCGVFFICLYYLHMWLYSMLEVTQSWSYVGTIGTQWSRMISWRIFEWFWNSVRKDSYKVQNDIMTKWLFCWIDLTCDVVISYNRKNCMMLTSALWSSALPLDHHDWFQSCKDKYSSVGNKINIYLVYKVVIERWKEKWFYTNILYDALIGQFQATCVQ